MDDVSDDAGPRPDVLAGADPGVDWPAEIRRERRRGLVVVLPALWFPWAVVLLTGDFLGVPRPAAWWVAAGLALLFLAASAVAAAVTSRRAHPSRNAIVQAAPRLRADPGDALREEVDRTARAQRSVRWAWPFMAFGAVAFFEQGRWSSPATAVPGAVLLALFWGAIVAAGLRRAAVCGRWLADPPGPPRPMPPEAAWERRRTTRLLLFGLPVVMALGSVAAVAIRAVTR